MRKLTPAPCLNSEAQYLLKKHLKQKGVEIMAEQNCAHSGCGCKVQEGKAVSRGQQTYCSNHCANASGPGGQGGCGCGHPDCRK